MKNQKTDFTKGDGVKNLLCDTWLHKVIFPRLPFLIQPQVTEAGSQPQHCSTRKMYDKGKGDNKDNICKYTVTIPHLSIIFTQTLAWRHSYSQNLNINF